MKYLKNYKKFEKSLTDQFLDTIHNSIKNETEDSKVIVVAGQFRFYLEEKYPNKLNEYLYRISDGENIISVILDISKNMQRDDLLYHMINEIFPNYNVECINDTRDNYRYDITIGNQYTIVDEFIEDNIEYLQLKYNDSGEPCQTYPKDWFIKT